MSSKDKDIKLLQDMLKVFFKKGSSAAMPARSELVVTAEMERELAAEALPHRRLRALRDLTEKALVIRIPEPSVKKIWLSIRDMLDDPSAEVRHAVYSFLSNVAEGQGDDLLIMRTTFFKYLQETHASHSPEDEQMRFKLLYSLTNSGKNITCFEEQIGAFLLEWLPQIQAPSQIVEFLQLITNVVKFNATYLDEEIVYGIVESACEVCERAAEAAAGAALALLEAVLSYSLLPRRALPAVTAALCRAANLEAHCHPAWKLMRSVLGADIGHATIMEMVNILWEASGETPPIADRFGPDEGRSLRDRPTEGRNWPAEQDIDAGLLRGAVFYISMALWGPRRVHTLQVSYLAIIPAFHQALRSGAACVALEVCAGVAAMARGELAEPAWDLLLPLLRDALDLDKSLDPPSELIHTAIHDIITSLEQLHDAGQFLGDPDALLDLIDYCGHDRPEASAMRLVSLRCAAGLGAGGGARGGAAGGGAAALRLAERYLRADPRPALRLHALHELLAAVARDRESLGEEVVERVGWAALGAGAGAGGAALRAAAARAVPPLAARLADATHLIDLLEKVLNRPFSSEGGAGAGVAGGAEEEGADVVAAGAGLARLVHARLVGAPAQAARALLLLLDHLERHYARPHLLDHLVAVRTDILELLFALRVNELNCVGFCYDSSGACVSGTAALRLRPLCSPLLLAAPPPAPPTAPHPAARPPTRDLPPGACEVSAGRVSRAVCGAVRGEGRWAVLGAVLRALPPALHARAPAVAHLPLLADTLCAMLTDRSLSYPECIRTSSGGKVPLSEFHGAVLPALAALAPHHAALDTHTQQRIVRCLLKYGMVLRTPQPYINALTIFTLEMRDTMVKMLPEVLLDLSKISDTKAIASPMLEFLSTLTRLPRVFASFVEDQYMSVFAILLPYTNPSRYNHYVVSLAHHVVAAWFLKCRLPYRRNFVRFIIHGLHNYIIMPFEEQLQYKSRNIQPPSANEDSSNRQRSSSLGSRAVSRGGGARQAGPGAAPGPRAAPGPGAGPGAPQGAGPTAGGGASAAFHVELTETCMDLLARYTSAPCSVKPQRSDLAEFLFTGGQSMTWLVGHKLITITTSGCLQNPPNQGPCERCAALCQQHAEARDRQSSADSDPDSSASEVRRYSKRSLQHWRGEPGSSSDGVSGEPADQYSELIERLERENKELEVEEEGWSRVGALAACGEGPCWSGRWAEVVVRAPTGDTAFVLRAQNAPTAREMDLERVPRHADLHISSPESAAPPPAAPPPAAPAPPAPPAPPHRSSTQPINIPGSPQRQSSSSTTDDDDLLLIVPEGKWRHPVRRSNSSPEMSSWKGRAPSPAPAPPAPDASSSACLLASKKAAKKSDMRVSCEAIPEEAGTSPLQPHAHTLMTYNSDPGTVDEAATQASSHHQLQKTSSDSTVTTGRAQAVAAAGVQAAAAAGADADAEADAAAGDLDLPPLARSKRSHTISVMSPTRRHRESLSRSSSAASASGGSTPSAAASGSGSGGGGGGGGGLTPAFVFLQLYHNMSTYPVGPPVPGEAPAALTALSERPLLVSGPQHERTVKNLDLVPPLDTYKVGVLYVGPGQQDDEVAILKNEYGSARYSDFLSSLGSLVPLDGAEHPHLFLNLETGGRDGDHTYVWHDDVMQVLFHVATAMPTLERDPCCNEKRKYIGNDYVSIVYNDSGQEFNIHTIKGQFNVCIVVVEPYEHGLNRVCIKSKDERVRTKFLAHLETQVASDGNVALLARQLALHAALAAQISQSLVVGGAPYASNSLERLRVIKRLRGRLRAERQARARPPPYHSPRHTLHIDDFNLYT